MNLSGFWSAIRRGDLDQVIFDQPRIRKLGLRILVQVLDVRVRRRRVEIEVVLFDVFTVIAFAAGQTEYALFQNRIATIPQRQRETHHLLTIADSGQTVFVPAVGARPRVIVWKIVPGSATGAVVFAHRAPGAFAHVGPPALPMRFTIARFLKPSFFSG